MTNEELLTEYITARDEANAAERRRLELRPILLARLKERHGRLRSRTATALLSTEERRTAKMNLIDNLIALGRLRAEVIAPAIQTKTIERITVQGVPETFTWETP